MCSSAFSLPSVVLYSILSAVCTETLSTIIPYFLIFFHIFPSSLLNHLSFFIFFQLLKACHDKAVPFFKDSFVFLSSTFSTLLQTGRSLFRVPASFVGSSEQCCLCVLYSLFLKLQNYKAGDVADLAPHPVRSTR